MVVGEEMNGEGVFDFDEGATNWEVRLRCSGAVGRRNWGDGLNSGCLAGEGEGGGGGLKPFTSLGSTWENTGLRSLVSRGTFCCCPAAAQDKAAKTRRHCIASLFHVNLTSF